MIFGIPHACIEGTHSRPIAPSGSGILQIKLTPAACQHFVIRAAAAGRIAVLLIGANDSAQWNPRFIANRQTLSNGVGG
jgi:hypothetical protein